MICPMILKFKVSRKKKTESVNSNPIQGDNISKANKINWYTDSATDCTPSKIWLLIRHGTRLPTTGGLERFSKMEKVKKIQFKFWEFYFLKRKCLFSAARRNRRECR